MKGFVSSGERRLYTRLKKRIPVSIHYNSHCVCKCFTSNIGIGGALLNAENLGLTENALVELTFSVNPWHALHGIRIPAFVAWRNEMLIGISFEILTKDTEDLMQDHLGSILVNHEADKTYQVRSIFGFC
ncbi:PilZ domain-containing protein [Kaarinaea lacus]